MSIQNESTLAKGFNPDQPRAANGQFGSGEGHSAVPTADERATGPKDFGSPEANALVRSWTTAGGSTQMDEAKMKQMTDLVKQQGEKGDGRPQYRGISLNEDQFNRMMSEYKSKSFVDLPATSFTTDRDTAQIYSESGARSVMVTILGGENRFLDVSSFAAENGFYESERVTAGRFRVIDVSQGRDGSATMSLWAA